jgi:ATP phosphoribosyltransferase regulatory subunit
MAHLPRPLRLTYGGPVLRVRPQQVGPAREALQMGAELIGSDDADAVAELLGIALEALAAAGLGDIAIDLTLPDLVPTLAAGPWPIAQVNDIQRALDGKDAAALAALGGGRYEALLAAAGPAASALQQLAGLEAGAVLGDRIAALRRLVAIAERFGTVTIDPTERHGFEYQSWIGFSVFAAGVRGEVGRGGSYAVHHPSGGDEPAVGFSLYVDGLVDAGLGASKRRRLFLPKGTDPVLAAQLRADGWATVMALTAADTAGSLRCDWLLDGDTPVRSPT